MSAGECRRRGFLVVGLLMCAAVATAQGPPAAGVDELWKAPPDPSTVDVVNGVGGAALKPKAYEPFRFVEKDTKGASPGWKVASADGMQWDVKEGVEAQAEVAVSRILWILGFHQPPMYYVPAWTLSGGPSPGNRGGARFRPEPPQRKRVGRWSWTDGPFQASEALRWLKVAMRLVNNWDLLDENTAIYTVEQPGGATERQYVVIDLGASLGKGAWIPGRSSKNDVEAFEKQQFVEGLESGGSVKFDDIGRRHRDLFKGIRPEHVRWVSDHLARLTDVQWRDLFRGAGYDEATGARFSAAMKKRIQEGLRLTAPTADSRTSGAAAS